MDSQVLLKKQLHPSFSECTVTAQGRKIQTEMVFIVTDLSLNKGIPMVKTPEILGGHVK